MIRRYVLLCLFAVISVAFSGFAFADGSSDSTGDTERLLNAFLQQAPQQKIETARKIPVEEKIRVLILEGTRHVHIEALSSLDVSDIEQDHIFFRHKSIIIESCGKKFKINGLAINSKGITVNTGVDDVLAVNGVQYRGKLKIQKAAHGGLDVLNILPLDEYLYGVIPKEMPYQWFSEALKAQAIVARTYALYQMEKNKNRPFDITATTDCQVYGGLSAERESSNRAVDETKGIVLFYNDQLVLAYFHAHSGGVTEDARRIWKAELPYLKSVRDDYSLKAPNNDWIQTFSLNEIRMTLNKGGGTIGPIKKISPHEISPTGRIMTIRITQSHKETIMDANEFRIKMGAVLIKSTFFDIIHQGPNVTFEGRGYGHGVGMSQWGAYVMAGEGFTWSEILQYYYQDVDIRKL